MCFNHAGHHSHHLTVYERRIFPVDILSSEFYILTTGRLKKNTCMRVVYVCVYMCVVCVRMCLNNAKNFLHLRNINVRKCVANIFSIEWCIRACIKSGATIYLV